MSKPYAKLTLHAELLEGKHRQIVLRKPECPTCGDRGETLAVFRNEADAVPASEALCDDLETVGLGVWS